MVYNFGSPLNRALFVRFESGMLTEIHAETYPCHRPATFVMSAEGVVWLGLCTNRLHIMVALAAGALQIQGSQPALLRMIPAFARLNELQADLVDVLFDC